MRTNSIPITEGLLCPCCGKDTRREWQQPSWNPNKPPLSQTDCINPACAGYYRTHSIERFMELFGTVSDNSPSKG